MLASNNIKYVMGPIGTTVTFPEEMRIPSILNSKPISYPSPREKLSIWIRNQSFLFAVSNSSRLYMRRWRLKLPLPLDVTNDPLSLAYANGTTLMVFCLGLLAEPSYWRLFIYSIILFDALLFRHL